MRKLLLLTAFIAGPVIYAQQKPATAKDINKAEIIKAEQNKSQATELKSLSDAGVEKSKASAKSVKAENTTATPRKSNTAHNLSDAAID